MAQRGLIDVRLRPNPTYGHTAETDPNWRNRKNIRETKEETKVKGLKNSISANEPHSKLKSLVSVEICSAWWRLVAGMVRDQYVTLELSRWESKVKKRREKVEKNKGNKKKKEG